jgi:hypothetical protein
MGRCERTSRRRIIVHLAQRLRITSGIGRYYWPILLQKSAWLQFFRAAEATFKKNIWGSTQRGTQATRDSPSRVARPLKRGFLVAPALTSFFGAPLFRLLQQNRPISDPTRPGPLTQALRTLSFATRARARNAAYPPTWRLRAAQARRPLNSSRSSEYRIPSAVERRRCIASNFVNHPPSARPHLFSRPDWVR